MCSEIAKTKVQESRHIQKARKKLEQQLLKESKLINAKALAQMKKNIQTWIERHQTDRVQLKERLEFFDENKHPMQVKSKFVQDLMDQLKKEMEPGQKPLKGRVIPKS